MNSPFKDSLFSFDQIEQGNQRKIDWTRGSPYTWKGTDIDEIIHSDLLFARKFSSDQLDLINIIKYHLSKDL